MGHRAEDRQGAIDIWVRSALEILTGLPAVRRVGLAFVETGGRQLSFTASDRRHRRSPNPADWCTVDAYDDVPLNNTVRSGRLISGSLEALAERYPEFIGRQERSTEALASVPLHAVGQVLGGFVLFYDTRQRFDDGQLEELRRLGRRWARTCAGSGAPPGR